jgi:hypothetical protein
LRVILVVKPEPHIGDQRPPCTGSRFIDVK